MELIRFVCKKGLQKMCKIFASKFESKLGVMRGFQKGITLGGRTSKSVQKVYGGWVGGVGWRDENRVNESPKELLIF